MSHRPGEKKDKEDLSLMRLRRTLVELSGAQIEIVQHDDMPDFDGYVGLHRASTLGIEVTCLRIPDMPTRELLNEAGYVGIEALPPLTAQVRVPSNKNPEAKAKAASAAVEAAQGDGVCEDMGVLAHKRASLVLDAVREKTSAFKNPKFRKFQTNWLVIDDRSFGTPTEMQICDLHRELALILPANPFSSIFLVAEHWGADIRVKPFGMKCWPKGLMRLLGTPAH